MKRMLTLAAMLGGLAFFTVPAYAGLREADRLPATSIDGATLFNVNDTSSITFAAVAAGGSDVYNRILNLGVSLNADDTMTFKCGTTTKIGPIYFSANSGLTQVFDDVKLRCGDDEAFNVTKGSSATGVTIWGNSRAE